MKIELKALKERALRNKRLQGSLERANRLGYFEVFTYECEKYNHEEWDETGNRIEKSTDVFDVEGHCCADFSGLYSPSFVSMIRAIWEWAKEDKFNWKLNPFKMPWSGWIWVIDSLESEKSALVDEWADETNALPDDYKSEEFSKACKERIKVEDKLYKVVTKDQVRNYLDSKTENYYKVNDFMWVNLVDPTCFVIDEAVFPFDLKDGWSSKKCAFLIGRWLESMDIYCGTVKLVDYPWE